MTDMIALVTTVFKLPGIFGILLYLCHSHCITIIATDSGPGGDLGPGGFLSPARYGRPPGQALFCLAVEGCLLSQPGLLPGLSQHGPQLLLPPPQLPGEGGNSRFGLAQFWSSGRVRASLRFSPGCRE